MSKHYLFATEKTLQLDTPPTCGIPECQARISSTDCVKTEVEGIGVITLRPNCWDEQVELYLKGEVIACFLMSDTVADRCSD